MRASQLFFPTQREIPKDAELASHQLLLRGGFIRNLAAGVYSYLPLGWRVHEKIAQIVREEANAFGGQELHMPVLVPKELLDESGRSKVPVLFRLKDRNERDFFLGFTHEEVVTDIVRGAISSWKQLPVYLYQIQTKERDEPRPRGGLVRGREFTMFDGYSFDYSEEMLDTIYQANYRAYGRVFERCGLEYLAVEADPGAIGGTENHEFMVLTPGGEDTVLRCDTCSYAANAERAEIPEEPAGSPIEAPKTPEVVATPGAHTVEQVCDFLHVSPQQLIKTIICVAGGKPVAALVRGDRELNLPKFARVLGTGELELADAATVERVTRAPVGFAGPVGLSDEIPIYADNELKQGASYVVGANQADAHILNVTPERDFAVGTWADIRTAIAGDRCPRCLDGHLTEARGIEVGHIFKLGVKYSKDMGALYQNEAGEKLPIIMGCYGLGVSRTMAAAVEAHHDDNGIVWPISIAPFEVAVLIANVRDEDQVSAANTLYAELQSRGVQTLLDEREERAGVKFKDMDLIGIPVQVVVGRGVADGTVEVGLRREGGSRQTVRAVQAAETIADLVASERARLLPGEGRA
ncbi:MAG TPA: proline--tRNA ligase [Chthonomonadaceae bacterium]|nr:proline--tRNA ligase [Chthonomonadaceae bacterium]